MKLTYDPIHNIGDIRFREKTSRVGTIRVSNELSIDLAPEGSVYGIELLNTSQQLQSEPFRELDIRTSCG